MSYIICILCFCTVFEILAILNAPIVQNEEDPEFYQLKNTIERDNKNN